jgi:NAD(P)-dependent dehydrogenase (short-subunit alcohol dehydrogenase family)
MRHVEGDGQLSADPREIADAVVHLASDESRYTVGSELIVDGGMSNL